ncbi:hypothetical protein DH2020_015298 [Rehmannia glutinosa]|uniref:Uncharacterized protein n=1 Tax=Rehmannia glutinosa TaxID=99300 RepID=A0ABR0WST3_REHGL
MMSYGTIGGGGATTVDCQKQVRSWRLLRSIAELLIPTCNCIITQDQNQEPITPPPSKTHTITGTIFGNRRGKVNFCIQTSPCSKSPILLLELAIPTNVLAREMKGGSTRFAFECKRSVDSGVVVGAGIARSVENDVMYLRGKFERFHGSPNSESFHLIDPDGNSNNGQELSFYFLRSR